MSESIYNDTKKLYKFIYINRTKYIICIIFFLLSILIISLKTNKLIHKEIHLRIPYHNNPYAVIKEYDYASIKLFNGANHRTLDFLKSYNETKRFTSKIWPEVRNIIGIREHNRVSYDKGEVTVIIELTYSASTDDFVNKFINNYNLLFKNEFKYFLESNYKELYFKPQVIKEKKEFFEIAFKFQPIKRNEIIIDKVININYFLFILVLVFFLFYTTSYIIIKEIFGEFSNK
ncbi:MAG: hypothetical protein CBC84_002400 [Pelagibacteraceae bacterium TMED124]|nr:hypothetical protein [Candidatus Neomarinimicrobiota bacterium]RPG17204.1 MAG: hypothetical protein CBC84_002400 [Pelagibacteraceae bacterium TMED124]